MKKCFCFLAFLVMTNSVFAGGGIWTGHNGSWTDGANWQNGVPTAFDTANLFYDWSNGGADTGPVVAAGDVAIVNNLLIGDGGAGTVPPDGDVSMIVTGGVLNVGHDIFIGANPGGGNGLGGILNVDGGEVHVDFSHLIIAKQSSGTVNQAGGIVTAATMTLNWFDEGLPNATVARYNLSGGVVTVDGLLHAWHDANLNITNDGELRFNTDQVTLVNDLVGFGNITANGVSGDVSVVWNGTQTIVTAIPEPSTIVLMGFGLMSIAGLACRRK